MNKDLNLSMSRNEAAEYLGVHPQTISNWAASGILAYIDRKNCKLYSRTQIEQMGEQLKDIGSKQELIDRLQKEIDAKLEITKFRWTDVCESNWTPKEMGKVYDRLSQAVVTIARGLNTKNKDIFNERELDIFEALMDMEHLQNVAHRYNVSQQTIMWQFNRVILKLSQIKELIENLVQERDELRNENDRVI